MAKLPDTLREPKPKLLNDLKAGEEGYVHWQHMAVTENGDCFLLPNSPVENTKSIFRLKVKRQEDGYHVVVMARQMTWKPKGDAEKDWIPVASITEDYDPDLNRHLPAGTQD